MDRKQPICFIYSLCNFYVCNIYSSINEGPRLKVSDKNFIQVDNLFGYILFTATGSET